MAFTKKRRRSRKKRYGRNRRRGSARRRSGISLAPRRVTIIRANPRRRRRSVSARRRHRRNPSYGMRGAARVPGMKGLLGPAIGVVGGFAGPFLLEPLVPITPTSGMGMFAKRAIAGVATGIAGNLLSSTRLISRKTANYVWVGIAANLVVNLLKSQDIVVPGFQGYPAGMSGGYSDVARLESYMQ